jgi:predicted aconitase with swiveling domain
MAELTIEGRCVVGGAAEGEAIVSRDGISFMGTVNPKTGVVIERKHELEGQCLRGKILVFPYSKGSTGGSYMLYDVVKNGVGPAGIINVEAEPVVTIGAIIAELPMVDQVDIKQIHNGDYVYLNADEGSIRIVRKQDA